MYSYANGACSCWYSSRLAFVAEWHDGFRSRRIYQFVKVVGHGGLIELDLQDFLTRASISRYGSSPIKIWSESYLVKAVEQIFSSEKASQDKKKK